MIEFHVCGNNAYSRTAGRAIPKHSIGSPVQHSTRTERQLLKLAVSRLVDCGCPGWTAVAQLYFSVDQYILKLNVVRRITRWL